MRLVAGLGLIGQAITELRAEPHMEAAIIALLASAAGLLMLLGLWTPISGALVAAFELWCIYARPGDPLAKILLGSLAVALALLGPGAWSVDARLFGWKRIDIRAPKS
jgi:uncharacterized membrane protein YphA (DoxX/SURF4 family)